MFSLLDITVVAESETLLTAVLDELPRRPTVTLTPYHLANQQPIELPARQDALILCLDNGWSVAFDHLSELIQQLPPPRPLLFAVSPKIDVELLRQAMRCGVRDSFDLPLSDPKGFLDTIDHLVQEKRLSEGGRNARLVTFINTKGGSGASLVAANLATALCRLHDKQSRLLLVDFDFQFGGLPVYLNMTAGDGLIKALERATTLDPAALQSYIQEHPSGLHLLATTMEREIILPEDVNQERIKRLLTVFEQIYDMVLIDIPRRIDTATVEIINCSNTLILVTQQTVAHLNDTQRLIAIVHRLMGFPMERMILIINRFDKRSEVRLEHFTTTFPKLKVVTLPSDYAQASQSINHGTPIADKSILGQALQQLAQELHQHEAAQQTILSTKKPRFGWLKKS
jgi:pilus assembly protein CpaE